MYVYDRKKTVCLASFQVCEPWLEWSTCTSTRVPTLKEPGTTNNETLYFYDFQSFFFLPGGVFYSVQKLFNEIRF